MNNSLHERSCMDNPSHGPCLLGPRHSSRQNPLACPRHQSCSAQPRQLKAATKPNSLRRDERSESVKNRRTCSPLDTRHIRVNCCKTLASRLVITWKPDTISCSKQACDCPSCSQAVGTELLWTCGPHTLARAPFAKTTIAQTQRCNLPKSQQAADQRWQPPLLFRIPEAQQDSPFATKKQGCPGRQPKDLALQPLPVDCR